MNSHIVMGTAGHVDHGKTAFIRHLTGIETDRLKDEQARGITIENGYAHLTLPSGSTIGFVDVPGHEKFIKTMLAGAMSIDAVLLIIAADEGIKPQTVEHFNIIKHLKINKGFIVITKCDLVDASRLNHLESEIESLTENSEFHNKPIVHYSIYDDHSREVVIDEIEKIAQEEILKSDFSVSRLNIDRFFSVKGFGTVVTGTLLEGQISKGDTLYLYPGEKRCRVKGIQVYGKSVEIAEFGQRTALNISLDLDEVSKGDTLTSLTGFDATMIVDVLFKTDQLDSEIKHWQRLKLYHGTKEILCRIVTGTGQNMGSFEERKVQLRLETPIYCKANDPVIIRSYSPMHTLGGGIILSPYAKKRIIDPTEENEYAETNALIDILKLNEFIFTLNDALFSKSSLSLDKGYQLFENLKKQGEVFHLRDDKYVLTGGWNHLTELLISEVLSEHKTFPLRAGIQKETLKSKIQMHLPHANIGKNDFGTIVQRLTDDGIFISRGTFIALKDHKIAYSNSEKVVIDQITRFVKEHNQGIVPIDDVINLNFNKNIVKEVLYHLINCEILVKINDESIIDTQLYNTSKERLFEFFKDHDTISVAEYRDLIGFSRKAAVALLEHFDKIQITKRSENTRTLIKK